MGVKVTKKKDKNADVIEKNLKKDKTVFRCGVFGSDDSKMVMIGAVHEFGCDIEVTTKMRGYFLAVHKIPLKVGTKIKIPARKWLSIAYAKNESFIKNILEKNIKDIATGNKTREEANNIIAVALALCIKGDLGKGVTQPKYRKGTPLIDNGDLRRSIGVKIDNGVTIKGDV